MTFAELRALFPATTRVAYLNAASASPLAIPVHAAARTVYDEMLEAGDTPLERWLRLRDDTRTRVAALVGAAPSQVAYVGSTSHAMNLVARRIRAAGLARTLVAPADEFPSSIVPFSRHGFEVRLVESDGARRCCPERLHAALRHAGPGAVLLTSAVQFATGFRIDLDACADVARTTGALFVVNATQAVGQLPFAIGRADAVAFCGHKWLMSGFGNACLVTTDALRAAAPPPDLGWLSLRSPVRFDNAERAPREDAQVDELGSPAFAPPAALGAALALIDAVGGPAAIAAHIAGLTAPLVAGLRDLGVEVISPRDPGESSGIVTFASPAPWSAEALVTALGRSGVVVSTRRPCEVRTATHCFNDLTDVERCLDALSRILRS